MSWFFKLLDSAGVNSAKVFSGGAVFTADHDPSAPEFCIAEQTGTIAAALAANSCVFAMRMDPGAGAGKKAYIKSMRARYTTIVAFTTPVTAGRRLALFRGSGAATSGGTAIAVAAPKDTSYPASEFDTASGGDIRIASTGALTVTGITFETAPMKIMTLSHVGTAGATQEFLYELDVRAHPIELNAGQLLAIRNPVAMDAAGTWQMSVEVDWAEVTE